MRRSYCQPPRRDPRPTIVATMEYQVTHRTDLTISGDMLPTEDPMLLEPALDMRRLRAHWASYFARTPMSAEEMRGAEARAGRLGVSSHELMEQAGAAVAAGVRALARTTDRRPNAMTLVLCGSGNNGGDGAVAARYLAAGGWRVVVALLSAADRPSTRDAGRNWERLAGLDGIIRLHCPTARDAHTLMAGSERAAVIVDALLGTGVSGSLREPIRTAVGLMSHARSQGVPILAVDTPTAIDLTSGVASAPVVRAHVTVTFHRPKLGLLTRDGAPLAGLILVAPIGIPAQADRG